jgi:hypothetical protein
MSAPTLSLRQTEIVVENAFLDRRGITIADQIAAIPFEQVETVRSADKLPRIKVLGKEYIPRNWTHERKSLNSWIWNHGIALVFLNPGTSHVKANYWACSECDKRRKVTIYMSNSTSTPARHLNFQHILFDPKKHAVEKPADD